jgi:flagellar protein FliO/FliZ
MNLGFGTLLSLLGVIALIPLSLWVLKRSPLGGAAHGPMKMVGMLALTPAQRLVTVEVGQGDERKWLVLAVGPTGVNTLHTMAPPSSSSETSATAEPDAAANITTLLPTSFARLLAAQRVTRKDTTKAAA